MLAMMSQKTWATNVKEQYEPGRAAVQELNYRHLFDASIDQALTGTSPSGIPRLARPGWEFAALRVKTAALDVLEAHGYDGLSKVDLPLV